MRAMDRPRVLLYGQVERDHGVRRMLVGGKQETMALMAEYVIKSSILQQRELILEWTCDQARCWRFAYRLAANVRMSNNFESGF